MSIYVSISNVRSTCVPKTSILPVAVTNDDETNILSSLLAKRYGTQRAMTLINNVTYAPLVTTLGIDVVVSPRAITASKLSPGSVASAWPSTVMRPSVTS